MGQEEKTQLLKVSCLTLEIKEFRGYEAKIEEVKRPVVAGSRIQDSSVAEHWWLKPGVSWVRLPVTAGLFNFSSFAS